MSFTIEHKDNRVSLALADQVRQLFVGKYDVEDDGACYRAKGGVSVGYIIEYLPKSPALLHLYTLADLRELARTLQTDTSGSKERLVAKIMRAYRSNPMWDYVALLKDDRAIPGAGAILQVKDETCLYITLVCARKGFGSKIMRSIIDYAQTAEFTSVCLHSASFALFLFYMRFGFQVDTNEAALAAQLQNDLPDPADGPTRARTFQALANKLVQEQAAETHTDWHAFERTMSKIFPDAFFKGIPMTLTL